MTIVGVKIMNEMEAVDNCKDAYGDYPPMWGSPLAHMVERFHTSGASNLVRQSPSIVNIAKALVDLQADLKPAVKDKLNPHFKSKYADLSAIIESVQPALAKHRLAIMQRTCQTTSGAMLLTMLLHESGEFFESEYPIGAYSDAQKMGSAVTYAKRYSLQAMLRISIDEDDDANAASKKPVTRLQQASDNLMSAAELYRQLKSLGLSDADMVKQLKSKYKKDAIGDLKSLTQEQMRDFVRANEK